MNRVEQIFAHLRGRDAAALMPFVTGGLPTVEATAGILDGVQRGGAHICELGFPFSDPIADGPVIQSSMTDALHAGTTTDQIFDMVRKTRPHIHMGLIAMVSYSIVYRLGTERFIERSKKAGLDGFIFPDLPVEEAGPVLDRARHADMTCSLLIAPTTPPARAEAIARASTGFVYLIARAGVTGTRQTLPEGLPDRVRRLRAVSDLPVAVGFGISSAQQVRAVTEVTDAAIVGSAIVREIRARADDTATLTGHVERFVRELAAGLRGAAAETS